ncbi:hypothetical protein ENBRE01_2278 [Enteropsectra breve]|nr:hypothetical protein ENBRE01_2278 [Enteropsectra breve]
MQGAGAARAAAGAREQESAQSVQGARAAEEKGARKAAEPAHGRDACVQARKEQAERKPAPARVQGIPQRPHTRLPPLPAPCSSPRAFSLPQAHGAAAEPGCAEAGRKRAGRVREKKKKRTECVRAE